MAIPVVAPLTVGRAIGRPCGFPAGGGEPAAPRRAEEAASARRSPAVAARAWGRRVSGAAGLPLGDRGGPGSLPVPR